MSSKEDIPDPPDIVNTNEKKTSDAVSEKSLSVQESLSEISESDVAKFPALFGVRQIVKSDPVGARSQLLEVKHFIVHKSKCDFN